MLALTLAATSLSLAQRKNPPVVAGEPEEPPVAAREYSASNWKSFSPAPGVSISMPGQPAPSERQINTGSGSVTEHIYLLAAERRFYRFSYFDSGVAINDPQTMKDVLDAIRDRALAGDKGMKLLKESEAKIGSYTGRELLIDSGDGMVIHQRFFIIDKRFYQMILASPYNTVFMRGRPDPNDEFTDFYQMISKKFFDSFETSGVGSGVSPQADAKNPSAPVAPLSAGVLNGRALSLPKPVYPEDAKQQRVTGTVVVQVDVNEQGRVMTAKAVAGPSMLRGAAEEAARKARFEPVKIQGEPVKVRGVVTYNFTY
jgi:TonB family protein